MAGQFLKEVGVQRQNAVGLYADGETPDLSAAVDTIRTGDDPTALEERIFGNEAAK